MQDSEVVKEARLAWLAERADKFAPMLNQMADHMHESSAIAGWWDDLDEICNKLTDEEAKKVTTWFFATKLCLVHSEVSEMMEGLRKGINDDHLPDRPMVDVEGGDVFIRMLDFFGGLKRLWNPGSDVGGATAEKFRYNHRRADHQKGNRNGEGGKKF